MNNKLEKWTLKNSFAKDAGSTSPPEWPHEFLVKLFSSSAYSSILRDHVPLKKGMKVLEIGCMGGNNLRFFGKKQCDIFGVEVSKNLVDYAQGRMYELQFDAVIKVGHNCDIPFNRASMDILVSINTLHYCHSEEVDIALKSLSDLLKKGGVAMIETVAPGHFFFEKSIKKGTLCFQSTHDDFRKNDLFGFFESEDQFKKALSNHFSEVEVMRLTERYSSLTLSFFIGIVKK